MTASQKIRFEKLLSLNHTFHLKLLQSQSQHTRKAPLKTRTAVADSFNTENVYPLKKKTQ